MRAQLEALSICELAENPIKVTFEFAGQVHVGHRTTLMTSEVVMVADERLGQLEPGELADAGHARHDALGLEHGEIAVDAARALTGSANHDLVDGERPTGPGQRIDEISAGTGVAAIVIGESRRHRLVQIRCHPDSVPAVLSVVPVLDIDTSAAVP